MQIRRGFIECNESGPDLVYVAVITLASVELLLGYTGVNKIRIMLIDGTCSI